MLRGNKTVACGGIHAVIGDHPTAGGGSWLTIEGHDGDDCLVSPLRFGLGLCVLGQEFE